ncbi:MAG: hypothetical protein RIS76_2197 [Verrucomicrobiota bacterium]|jgi:Tfp pilus assembly pilus retraction ATPase PilT
MNRRRCLTGVWRNVTRTNLESLIGTARQQGASDLHLEAGLGPALRIRGTLRPTRRDVSRLSPLTKGLGRF